MKRRVFLQYMGIISWCSTSSFLQGQAVAADLPGKILTPLNKPTEEWRTLVTPEAYRVLFEEETEEPGSSELNHEHRDGTYVCAACNLPLFESRHKYDSGSGWPSFTQPIAGHIDTKQDFSLIFLRIEYHCARCGGHQGHVFKDGPPPRGERWCNNGVALKFVPITDRLPNLRQ